MQLVIGGLYVFEPGEGSQHFYADHGDIVQVLLPNSGEKPYKIVQGRYKGAAVSMRTSSLRPATREEVWHETREELHLDSIKALFIDP